jgi:hypothetical protein
MDYLQELIDKLKVDLITAASRVNYYSAEKDLERNRVNYGIANESSDILQFLKIDADAQCYEDEGFLKITKVIIDGKETVFMEEAVNA